MDIGVRLDAGGDGGGKAMTRLDRLEARVRDLERGRRGARLVAVAGMVALVAAGVLVWAADGELPALKARSLDIVNDEGAVVVHLGVRSSGAGGVWITGSDGARVLKLNQAKDGSGLITVLSASGNEIARLPR
jgi:hypothetical protein